MSVSFRLYIYTKNTDLHAMSALETLRSVMGVTYIKQLRRFRVVDLTFATSDSIQARTILNHIIETSYHLLNPNKEGVIWDVLPLMRIPDEHALVPVLVSPIQRFDDGVMDSLNRSLSFPMTALQSSLLWECVVDRMGRNDHTLREDIYRDIVCTSGHTHGVLMNPISELAEFPMLNHIYQSK